MESLLLVLHVVIAVSIVVIILLQQGKGADAGASFGGGASGTMFGSLGAMPFLTKLTAVLAVLFFVTSMTLAILASRGSQESFNIEIPGADIGTGDMPAVKVNEPVIESDLPILEDSVSPDRAGLPVEVLEGDLPTTDSE